MLPDVLLGRLKQLRNERLRQPDGLILKPALDARAPVLGLIENDFRLRCGFFAHGIAFHFKKSAEKLLPVRVPCLSDSFRHVKEEAGTGARGESGSLE